MRRPATEPGLCPVETTVFEVNPIAGHAPRANRALSALTTALVYGGLATGVVALGHAKVAERLNPRTDKMVDITFVDPGEAPPLPPPPPPTVIPAAQGANLGPRPADLPMPVVTDGVPETPTNLPTQDMSKTSLAWGGETVGPVGPSIHGTNPDPGPRGAAPGGVKVMELSVSQLRVLHQERPVYPAMARMTRIQGDVELLITVDEQGRPAQVVPTRGPAQLHGEAIRCAQGWRFEPARMDGQPVPARFHLTIQFRLN